MQTTTNTSPDANTDTNTNCASTPERAKSSVPNRCETAEAMQALQSDIARCSPKAGAVHVTVVFDSYGLAKDVQVNGKGYDADALLCVKGNGLRAKVRPFTAEKFVVEWDYRTGGAPE